MPEASSIHLPLQSRPRRVLPEEPIEMSDADDDNDSSNDLLLLVFHADRGLAMPHTQGDGCSLH